VPEYKNTTQRDATDGVFSLTTTTVKTVTASSAINSLLAKYGGSSFRLETKQDLWHYAQQASGAVIFNFGAVFTAPMIGGNEWEYVLKREVNPYPGRIVKATFYVIPDADGSIVSAGERAERAFLDALQTLVLDTLSDEAELCNVQPKELAICRISRLQPNLVWERPRSYENVSEQTLQFLSDVAKDAAALRVDDSAEDTAFALPGSGTNSEAENTASTLPAYDGTLQEVLSSAEADALVRAVTTDHTRKAEEPETVPASVDAASEGYSTAVREHKVTSIDWAEVERKQQAADSDLPDHQCEATCDGECSGKCESADNEQQEYSMSKRGLAHLNKPELAPDAHEYEDVDTERVVLDRAQWLKSPVAKVETSTKGADLITELEAANLLGDWSLRLEGEVLKARVLFRNPLDSRLLSVDSTGNLRFAGVATSPAVVSGYDKPVELTYNAAAPAALSVLAAMLELAK
jgi:hypothetical protein